MTEEDLQDILNYRRIHPQLATGGQPRANQFTAIGRHFDCVINLARADSPGAIADEAERVRQAGCDYVHIPVDFRQPDPADLDRFFEAVHDRADQRLFVHCALNWRVSAFVFLYRVLREGVPLDDALADLLAVWTPDPVWQAFIDSVLERAGRPPIGRDGDRDAP